MKWLDKLMEYAPDIAGAVLSGGVTLPQLALKAIADATGQEVSDETQAAEVIKNASPEVMLKVKQSNNSFKIRMAELGERTGGHRTRRRPARSRAEQTLVYACVNMWVFDRSGGGLCCLPDVCRNTCRQCAAYRHIVRRSADRVARFHTVLDRHDEKFSAEKRRFDAQVIKR